MRLVDRAADGELSVRSNFLFVRVKRDDPAQLLSGERHDVLRFDGSDLKLARRLILLDHSFLPTENLRGLFIRRSGCRSSFVTGGTYGIGYTINMVLAERGHNVVAFGMDTPPL